MITHWIGRHEVLLPINHKNYNFREKLSKCRNIQNGFTGCQVKSEKQVLCQSKTQPCLKNAQLRRALQKLVKIPNRASQGIFFLQNSRFLNGVGVDHSSLQAVNIRARVIRDFQIHYGGLLLRLLWPWGTRLTSPFPPQTSNRLRFRHTATGCSASMCLYKNWHVRIYSTFIRQGLDLWQWFPSLVSILPLPELRFASQLLL